MKKTRLGKVTFVLVCVCLALFVTVKILDVWGLGRNLGGFHNMTRIIAITSGQGEVMNVLLLLGKIFVIPVIWTLVGFFYVLGMKRCKPIKQGICLASALAVLAEFILLAAGEGRYFWQLMIRICFVIVFMLLFLEFKKSGFRRWIFITFGLTYTITLVYVIRYMINVIRVWDMNTAFYVSLAYILLPVVFLIVCVLALGYILFPEKYIEA